MQPDKQSELVFYIRHQRGFTARLYQHALAQPGSSVPVFVDGPYGGINLQKYHGGDHLLVIAGGSGAGWCLPFIEQFVRNRLTSGDAERGQAVASNVKEAFPVVSIHERSHSGPLSMRVILATRDTSSRIWFLQTVSELLLKYSATDSSSHIRIQVYLTGDAAQEVDLLNKGPEVRTSSNGYPSPADEIDISKEGHEATVPGREFGGRPQLPLIIQEEAAKVMGAGQSLSVFVCGPTTMNNDVRNAVAKENLHILKGAKSGGVYLHSEHFEWA